MAFTEFYVTKGSAVNAYNGGGPSLGTNDGPVETRGNSSSNAGGTIITDDDGGGWALATVGDWLCFDTGTLREFARITVISSNDLTVTPAVTGSTSGVETRVGGAWDTIDRAADRVTTSFVNAAGAPPRVNIGSGTYAETVSNANSGTQAIPLTFEGYETTAGDRTGTRPLITGSSADAWQTGMNWLRILNVRCETSTANQHGMENKYAGGGASHNVFIDCVFKGGSGSGKGYYDGAYSANCYLINCHAKTSGSHGFSIDYGADCVLIGCVSTDAGGHGFNLPGTWGYDHTLIMCVADNPTLDGIYAANTDQVQAIVNCTVYSPGSDGIEINAFTTSNSAILNCVLSEHTTYGINIGTALQIVEDYNCFYKSGGGSETNNVITQGANDETLSGDPFEGASTGDFSLDDTAGEGTTCRGAGLDASEFGT